MLIEIKIHKKIQITNDCLVMTDHIFYAQWCGLSEQVVPYDNVDTTVAISRLVIYTYTFQILPSIFTDLHMPPF